MSRGGVEPYAKRVCGVLKKDLRERRKFAAQTCFLHRSDSIELLCTAKDVVCLLLGGTAISASP